MPSPSTQQKKRERFMAMVRGAGPLPSSLLATAIHPRSVKVDQARRVAELLVGGLPSLKPGRTEERVSALASKLADLKRLDSETPPAAVGRSRQHG